MADIHESHSSALQSELATRAKAKDEVKHDPSSGRFTGSGGGSSLSKTNPGMDPGRAKAIAGGARMNPREVAQKLHHEQYPSGGRTLRSMVAAKQKQSNALPIAKSDPAKEGAIAAGFKGGTPAEQGSIAARDK